MKILPAGKGWAVWQIKRIYGGDPNRIAAAAVSQNIDWVGIKVNDGAANYNLRQLEFMGVPIPGAYVDDLIQPLVDALHAEGIMVFVWGYIYLNNAVAEAAKSIERYKKFGVEGFIVDAEKEWKFMVGPARVYMDALRAGLPDVSIGMCTYRWPSVHREFPWYTALENADYHMPQVYWLDAHNPVQQLNQSVAELKAKKDIPIIPLGYAYQNEFNGTRPTQAEMVAFHNRTLELGLPGNGWYEWGDAIVNADVEKFVAPLVWDGPMPPPIGDAMYNGTVIVDKVNVRAMPSPTAQDVGDLFRGNLVSGDRIVNASGYDWLEITQPVGFAGAFVALGPTSAPRSFVRVEQVEDPGPVPLTLEERVTKIEADIVEIKKKLQME